MTWPGQENQGGGPGGQQPYPWGPQGGQPPTWGQSGQPGGYPPPPPGAQGPTAPGGYPPPPGPPGPYGPTQPAGGYPPPPGGSGSSGSMATLIVVAAVALILIGGGTTAFFLLRDDSGEKQPVAKQTPTASASPTGTPSPGASPTDLQGFTPPPPKVAGWQVVVSKKRNVAYDVPPDWKVETEGTLIGYERQKPKAERVIMSGAATLRQPEFCDGEKKNIAISGVTGDDESNQAKAAKATAEKWADLAFTSDDGKKKAKISLRPAKNLDFGKSKAVQVTADVTPGEKPGCTVPPKATVTAVAIEARQGGSVMFIVVNHQNVDGAASEQDVEKIISSIRGAQQPSGG